MSRSTIFKNQKFAIAGTLNFRSHEDVIRAIIANGGLFEEKVSPSTTVVLSTEEMGFTLGNAYKCQFLPDFVRDVTTAQTYSKPIVLDSYVDDCIMKKQLLSFDSYIIPAFLIDTEAKFKLKAEAPSSLDPRVQQLVQLLFDQNSIDRDLVDLGVDVRRISQVTQKSISDAWSILKQLEGKLVALPTQTKQQHEDELSRISNLFYNLIPHRGDTPAIKSADQIKAKSSLLESLTDVEIALRMMKEKGTDAEMNMSPIDVKYRKLRAELTPLEDYRSEYQLIKEAIANTQSTEFKFKIELDEVFEVVRDGEPERFAPFVKLPHHRLLWHGSRLSNYVGILSQGIRIAPPEAPVTGYFLGKGAYFADMVSVSGQYLKTTNAQPVGLMLLCDVALGRTFQIAHGKFISKEDLDEAGFHSVKCCGTKGPDPGYDQDMNDASIALGKETRTGVPISELIHNELVVYDAAQVQMKYLIKVRVTHHEL